MRARIALAVVVVVVACTTMGASALQPDASTTPDRASATVPAPEPALAGGLSGSDVRVDTSAQSQRRSSDRVRAPTVRASANVIVENVTMDRTPADPGSVDVSITYELPDSVSKLEVRSAFVSYDDVSVVDVDGFQRSSSDTFQWDGASTGPTITFAIDVPHDQFQENALGVEANDWAFVALPDPYVSWTYRGQAPSFESTHHVAGDGHATAAFALDGATSTVSGTTGDVEVIVAVAPDARPEASLEGLVDVYRVGHRELEFGFEYEESGIYVLPEDALYDGAAAGSTTRSSFWMQDRYSTLDDPASTPIHEYVHTRFGSFGSGSSAWLTEASAEYYGAMLAMNTGRSSWSSFRESLRVPHDSTRHSTLTEPRSWANAYVPYDKGSLVLAALDLEIRERTGGARTLEDVLAYRFSDDGRYGDLETYENFSAAVVDVTNDESVREWLDRYVAGDETPPLPEDPDRFALNASMDSDGDGLTNGEEAQTNPFDTDTDGDGVDDGEDAYPADDSKSVAETSTTTATTTTTTATATEPGTTERPTTAATTGKSTSATSATTTRDEAESTGTATAAFSETEDDGSGESTESAEDTSVGATQSTDTHDDERGDADSSVTDDVPGFGPVVAAIAAFLTVLAVRVRRDAD